MSLLASCGSGGSDSSTAAAGSAPAGTGQSGAGSAGIASFGEEAGPADRAAATTSVQQFLRALAADDSARACSLMSASTKRNLAVFASQLKTRGCTGQLEAVRSAMPAKVVVPTKGIQMTGVRISGARGFVLYRDAHGTNSAFPVVREGSAWKIGAIAATRIP